MKTKDKKKSTKPSPSLPVLGRKVSKFTQLDTFPAPRGVATVTCVSDEVTALCPVTGQPDWYTVTVKYVPNDLCVESKSLKLYLQSFRNMGHFCENFAGIIAERLYVTLRAQEVRVSVLQKPRGGIAIESEACFPCD